MKKMYCTTKTLKAILCGLNLLCALLAAFLIWFGAWLLNSVDEVNIDHGENIAAIVILTLGAVVLLIAVFGCVSIYLESKRMLIAYAVILIVLLVIQLILVSFSYAATSSAMAMGLNQGFDDLWDHNTDLTNSTLSYYEKWLHCCGKSSAEDYYWVDRAIPQSCCKDLDCSNPQNLYIDGCEQKFKDYMHAKTCNFNVLSWFVIVVEFIGSVFACYLVDSIQNHLDRKRFYS